MTADYIEHNDYNGRLKYYDFPYIECGTDLHFLSEVQDKNNTYLVNSNWNISIPNGYDTYIITALGESLNTELLNVQGRKIVICSEYTTKMPQHSDTHYFTMEHLHWYTNPVSYCGEFFKQRQRKPLNNRLYSFGCLNQRPDNHKEVIVNSLLQRWPDQLQYTWVGFPENPNFTKRYNIAKKVVFGHQWDVNNNILNDSRLIWVTESMFDSCDNMPTAYLSEKTIKAIVTKSMFVICGQRLSYKRLRECGFETFESHFNIDWDMEWDDVRMSNILNLIETFDYSLDRQDLVDYNYNYFYNDFFERTNAKNSLVKEEILAVING